MTENPRYYWLKLSEDFLNDKRIKILKKRGGAEAVIIYEKMLLKAISNSGIIEFAGLTENFHEELALVLDEDDEVVKNTLAILQKCSLIKTEDGISYFLPQAVECTGSETKAAERMRKTRKNKAEQECNGSVTNLNNVQKCYIEKEIEKEIEIESESESEKETEKETEIDSFTEEEELPVITLILQNGESYPVSSSELKKWNDLYPKVDIEQQLRSIKGWFEANPDKRKQKQNMAGYINAWLTRKQEEADKQAKAELSADVKKPYTPYPNASYDIWAVEEKMNKTVPKLKKRKR